MKKCRAFVIFISTIVIGTAFVRETDACSCMPTHPQAAYCGADFAILAKIAQKYSTNVTTVYKIQIKKVFKISDKARVALKFGRLLTSTDESTCGVRYEKGKVYAITGSVHSLQARVNLCHYSRLWRNLTPRIRKGFRSTYSRGCSCNIHYCPFGKCGRTANLCVWKSDCQEKYGACLRSASNQCLWVKNRFMKQCMKTKESPFNYNI